MKGKIELIEALVEAEGKCQKWEKSEIIMCLIGAMWIVLIIVYNF